MGPFPIIQINDNGTVRFQKGIINDATNIRRIKPFFDYTNKNSFHNPVVSLYQMIMERFTFNKESSMMPLIIYQHLIFHFYDIPHPNHWGECSIPCSFDNTGGSSQVVTHRTEDGQVTAEIPSTH